MKNLLILLVTLFCLSSNSHAAVKEVVYQGQEIEFNTSKEHTSVVIFPEPIKGVVRGFGADTYVIQRRDSDPKILELMPTASETAEITVSGVSGEQYVLKMLYKEDYHSKVTILPLKKAVDDVKAIISDIKNQRSAPVVKKEELTVAVDTKKDIPPGVVPSTKMDVQTSVDLPKPQDTRPFFQGTPATDSPPTLPAELNSKITLKGSGLPLKIYLSAIAKATGYNIIATPEVEAKKATINLENIEVWRALKSLLYPLSYGFKVSKEDLIISASESRVFNIYIPSVEQSFSDTTSNESFTNQAVSSSAAGANSSSSSSTNEDVKVGTKIYMENRSSNQSLWEDLENNIKTMVTPQTGVYSVNKTSGQIIVTDLPGVLDRIGEFVAQFNAIMSREQTFELQVIEVALTDQHQAGIDWNALTKSLGRSASLSASTNFATSGFTGGQVFSLTAKGLSNGAGITDNGVSAVLKALEDVGRVEVISKPRITVSNRIPCILQEGTSKAYISQSGQTITSAATTTTLMTSQAHAGLTMRLVARIGEPNEDTMLNITAEVSTIDSIENVKSGDVTIQTPQQSHKSITTNVNVRAGRSLVIGGLISTDKIDSSNGVPGLSHVPVVGNAFKYKTHKNNKSELVIVITPKTSDKN